MKAITILCLSALSLVSASAVESGPIRVLYLDPEGKEQTKTGALHDAMRDLGRDAIWFDYAKEKLPAETFDLVIKAGEAKLDREGIISKLSAERKASYEAFLAQREAEKREPHPQVANYEKREKPITFQHPFTTKGSLERIQVPADCEVKLFAAEPDIAKPIAFAWDERGRCWVVETRDYPHGISDKGEGQDSVKICEDTDGDGKADKFTVFADKLNLPTGIVFARGGIIVAAPPKFIFLKDTNGDDKADVCETIIDCWGIKDTHAQASSLHYGFDNWIYGCVGYSGIEGKIGGKQHKFSMGTYRFKPDGSALEFLHQFTNNAWAHSTNDAGDQFGGTANGAPLFFGGIPATAWPEGSRGMTAKKINAVETCHTITPNFRQVDVFGGYTSAAGSNFIYSNALPKRFQGMAMICEPTMKVVALMDIQPDGAGWKALDAYNLFASTDEWTSPVHAEVGPDGAVWIADFQNYIIQHNPTPSLERGGFVAKTGTGGAHENDLRDHSRGRIYRITAKGTNPKSEKPSLSSSLLERRLFAQREVVESGMSWVTGSGSLPDKNPVISNEGQIAAIHSLWGLHGVRSLQSHIHRAALLSKDAKLRRNAIRALGNDKAAHDLFFGTGVITDPDLHTRLAAMVKLSDFATTPEIQTLVKKLAADPTVKNDEWLAEAAKMLGRKHKALNYKEGPNLLPNPGFETLAANKKLPEGWKRRDYGGDKKKEGNKGTEWEIVIDKKMVHSGKHGFRVITRADADTSFFADVSLKPNTEYKLSAWIKTHAFKGKASLNDHIGRAETKTITRNGDWAEVEVVFNSKERPKASINLLHVAKGDTYFDDVSLVELIPEIEDDPGKLIGDAKRGENIFWNHPVAACKNCHVLKGQGSPVGPALDGIATRKDEAYITESLVNPNARLAEGYVATPISPMPPLNLILKPQEFADVRAFVLSLK